MARGQETDNTPFLTPVLSLPDVEENLPAVALRPDGEVGRHFFLEYDGSAL